jgi:signal transduction histidine kinase
MRDRLALVNADLVIESSPGSGTRICTYIDNTTVAAEKSA